MWKCIVFLFALCCAATRIDAQDGVVKGTPIQSMVQFPHHVTIQTTSGDSKYYCSGSILNPWWVLTVKSCVNNNFNYELIFNRTSLEYTQWNSFSINVDNSGVYASPDKYAALFKLPIHLTFSEHIQPVSLVSNGDLHLTNRIITTSGKVYGASYIGYSSAKITRVLSTNLSGIVILNLEPNKMPCMQNGGAGVLIGWPEDPTLIGLTSYHHTCEYKKGDELIVYKIADMMPWIISVVNNGNF